MSDEGKNQGLASLFKKMTQVMGELHAIPALGKHPTFGYSFIRNDDVMDATRTLLAKHGIAFFFAAVDVHQEPLSKGYHSVVKGTATFGDADTGAFYTVPWAGEANDTQDKSVSKAMTMAVKYGLIKTFLIPIGDADPDGAGGGPPKAGDTSQKQEALATIRALMKELFECTTDSHINFKLHKQDLPGIESLTEKQAVEVAERLENAKPKGGNGDPTQPIPPPKIKLMINATKDARPASEKQAKLVARKLDELLKQAGSEDAQNDRHAVQLWLTGEASASELTKGQVKGIIETWLEMDKEYQVRGAAVQEIKSILTRAKKEMEEAT